MIQMNLQAKDRKLIMGRGVQIQQMKKVMDSLNDCMASDVLDIRDPEELEVYGNEKQPGVQITSYVFEVCDSLLNIGPCGNISIGEPAFLSEEFNNNPDLDLELVTTAGYGKNGALCVLQRTIRPQIVTTFTLPGCSNMWTVKIRRDGTMVLQTGHEINEIDNTGFATHCPTVYAGNLGNNKYIVQVTTVAIRLLHGAKQLQHVPMDIGSPIVHVSSADPYISLMTTDGQVITLMLREARGVAKLVVSKSTLANNPPVSTICMYKDTSGLFTNKIPEEFTQIPPHKWKMKMICYMEKQILKCHLSIFPPPKPKVYYNWWKKYLTPNKPTYWLFVVRDNSNLEIYSIPDFKLSFYVTNLCFGYKVLVDSLESVTLNQSISTSDSHIQHNYQVKELLMIGLGNNGSRPLLLVRLDNDLYIYEVFRFPRGNLKLRFKKLKLNIIYSPNMTGRIDTENSDFFAIQERIVKLRYFDNISGYNGVFICGSNPHWLFLTSRGELRTHAMVIDGEVLSFAAFNNINCPQGFLYFNKKSELREVSCQHT
ncbi:hypothetical protein NQ317_013609 [Molorchus minor]|uniref:RSE1/DDB1/CPSF1 second beta-propeller domain-containing protein n=1 Tax=Molorchus minor TaxID=1323400 RepID=A0ABQ9J4Q5_9CUCU|nr:hypothetical protein NQ317_013609 [Molorchus minor]